MPDAFATADVPSQGINLAAGLSKPRSDDVGIADPDVSELKRSIVPAVKRGQESQDPVVAGASNLIAKTMSLEGQGKDPNSNAVAGFMPAEWGKIVSRYPEAQGKSPEDVLQMRYDHSPQGLALQARAWGDYYSGTAAELKTAGLPVNDTTLRLTSRLGGPDAIRILQADPETPLELILKPAVFDENRELRGLTAGQMVSFTTQQMEGKGNPFAHYQAGMEAMADLNNQSRAASEQSIANLQRDQDAILRRAAEAAPDTAERRQMLHEAHEHARELIRLYEQKISNPPEKKPADLFAGWGGIVIALAAFAGSRSGQPLTAALNGMSGAMDALNQGNERDFQEKFRLWEKQSDYALKAIDIQNQDIREILEDQRMAESEKQAQLNTLYHVAGMDQQIALQRSGQIQQERSNLYQMLSLGERAQFHQDETKKWKEDRDARIETAKLRGSAGAHQQALHDDYIKIWQSKPENAGQPIPPEVDLEAWRQAFHDVKATGSFDKKAADAAAGMIANYQLAPLSGYAMRSEYGQYVMGKVNELAPAYSSNQYWSRRAAEQTVGRRGATLMMASNAADQLIPIVEDLSAKVKRTEFPDFNSILLAGETKIGNPDVVAFGQALNSLLYVYMRALNPSGIPRVADLERGTHILATNWSQGQLTAALTQMKREIGAEKVSLSLSSKDVNTMFGSESENAKPWLDAHYDSPEQVYKAFDDKHLTKDQVRQILLNQFGDQFGYKPQ